jgi:hypothetical protein
MTILTEAPIVLAILCPLAGIIYAGAMYFRDRLNATFGKTLATLLAVMRFIAVTCISFFLLEPLIKSIHNDVEKPIVLFCQDNSQSVAFHADSAFYTGPYLDQIRNLQQLLGENYDVQSIRFDTEVQPHGDSANYRGQATNYTALMNHVSDTYGGRNLGAMIVASDGLFNQGSNPLYSGQLSKTPLYTVALGDTTIQRDLALSEVNANRLAYLGNKFPVSIVVQGKKAGGESAVLKVSKNGQTYFQENISIQGDAFMRTVDLTLDATEIGIQKYTIEISGIANELTLVNNRKDLFIDVLDSREKILLVAHSPHPDINAIRDAIESVDNYRVDVVLAKDVKNNLSEYNLAILHQLPAVGGNGVSLIQNLLDANIPCWFIWGSATDYRSFNNSNYGIALDNYRNSITDASMHIADGFSLFTVESDLEMSLRSLPPLSVPFGDIVLSPGAVQFGHQQIGQIKTQKPLIVFNKFNENKIALLAGEGIWRWRIASYQQYNNHQYFDQLITKITQYMSAKEDKSLFRVNGKNDFLENERIVFDAELYNQSYEAITHKEVKMRVISDEGLEYDFNFSPNATRYRLDAGQLPPGNYSYIATASTDQGPQERKGQFSISALDVELTNTVADHRLMYQWASSHDGQMVLPSEMASLAEMIKARKDVVSIAYEHKELKDLINYKWLLAALLGLLCIEWLLRKRAGAY